MAGTANAIVAALVENTQPSITLDWSQGSGSTATQISFTITQGAYVAAVIDRSKDFVEVDVDVDLEEFSTEELIKELEFRNVNTPTKMNKLVEELFVAKATNKNIDQLLNELFLNVLDRRL